MYCFTAPVGCPIFNKFDSTPPLESQTKKLTPTRTEPQAGSTENYNTEWQSVKAAVEKTIGNSDFPPDL